MTVLSKEECSVTLSEKELIEQRRRIIASMSKEDWRNMMNQVTERAAKRSNDDYVRQQTELYKQTDRYKEYEKRKLAERENEKRKLEETEQNQ
jgi:predicted glycosyl hydrolase (DUF1957 family)